MKIRSLFFAFFLTLTASSQNVGIGTNTPHSSAALDISSTNKGFLTPRMTTAQRNAIASPVKGLMVYDTDLNTLQHYNGSSWAAVGKGGLALPYTGSASHTGATFAITNTNTSDGEAITGTASSTFTPAIEGTNQNTGGIGVRGISSHASGYGVQGTTVSGSGVYGWSTGSGVGLRGVSASGYALLTSGNLRLTGGNTNPAAGAVLTSVDANGNAVWKPKRIAFSASFAQNNFITAGVDRKIEFQIEDYDFGNSFTPFSGTVTENTSVFTAPVSGLYKFSASLAPQIVSDVHNFSNIFIGIMKNGVFVAQASSALRNGSVTSTAYLIIDKELLLSANDRVWIVVTQNNGGNLSASVLELVAYKTWFSGHLVFAD